MGAGGDDDGWFCCRQGRCSSTRRNAPAPSPLLAMDPRCARTTRAVNTAVDEEELSRRNFLTGQATQSFYRLDPGVIFSSSCSMPLSLSLQDLIQDFDQSIYDV